MQENNTVLFVASLTYVCFIMQFYSVVSQKVEALKMEPKILDRNVNEGFSGGERKRNEILQLSVRLI